MPGIHAPQLPAHSSKPDWPGSGLGSHTIRGGRQGHASSDGQRCRQGEVNSSRRGERRKQEQAEEAGRELQIVHRR